MCKGVIGLYSMSLVDNLLVLNNVSERISFVYDTNKFNPIHTVGSPQSIFVMGLKPLLDSNTEAKEKAITQTELLNEEKINENEENAQEMKSIINKPEVNEQEIIVENQSTEPVESELSTNEKGDLQEITEPSETKEEHKEKETKSVEVENSLSKEATQTQSQTEKSAIEYFEPFLCEKNPVCKI